MPELGPLLQGQARNVLPAAGSSDARLQDAYEQYLSTQRSLHPQGQAMPAAEFERLSLGSQWLANVRDVTKKLVQTCRLMVGVHDYEYYLDHMRSTHPGAKPFSREEFYRYCLDARFPSAGNVNKCPC
ncbi:YbdD/YjiX family protein [Roseateles sp. BYS180W]|uniref:YbdD/YjiX family protein n=1 Tax=Roseateles rivi TaxID=3299028 RepID=A0ABW7FTF0_9BURK